MNSKTLIIAMLCPLFMLAQNHKMDKKREKIEVQKIAFITKQLDLTPEEAQKFWPVYNQFSDAKKQLHKQHKENRKDIDNLSDSEIAEFQIKISKMGYKFQFITLAGFHIQNLAVFELAEQYKSKGMTAYSKIQQQEFAREKDGYTSVKHQREVGTSYFDAVSNTISSGESSTTAMKDSTESEQF